MGSPTEQRVVLQAFRFELDPNQAQRVLLAKSVGCSRFVYNWGLAESQRTFERTGKRPRLSELKASLVTLKKSEAPWLYEVSAHIGQQALVDLNAAFSNFFDGLKSGPACGFPRFHKKGERDSARLYEVTLEERHLRLPMIGRVRLKETRTARGFEGRILSATISRRADRWFCSLAVEREREIALPKLVRGGRDVVGIDLGLKSAAVIHDGQTTRAIPAQQTLRRNLVKLARLDRQLARKRRGSANREKAKLCRARLHYRVSCQRNDFLHHLSSELTKTKSVIVLENLNVEGMKRGKRLGLSVGDAGMGELRRQVTYKAEWYGARLIMADRFFPSTQLCSGCGILNPQVKGLAGLKERLFACPACGLTIDRDENAAINLRAYGLQQLQLPEGLREVTPVEKKALVSDLLDETKPASAKQEATARRSQNVGFVTRIGATKDAPVLASSGTNHPT
jgi:putative transposase